jgi:hypothetical protein
MKQKLTLTQIFNATPAIQKLVDKEIPVALAYKLSKNLRTLGGEMEIITNLRMKLFEKYGDKDAIPGQIVVPEGTDNHAKFIQEMTELMNQPVEIEIDKVPLQELGDLRLSISDVMAMEYLFTDTN